MQVLKKIQDFGTGTFNMFNKVLSLETRLIQYFTTHIHLNNTGNVKPVVAKMYYVYSCTIQKRVMMIE